MGSGCRWGIKNFKGLQWRVLKYESPAEAQNHTHDCDDIEPQLQLPDFHPRLPNSMRFDRARCNVWCPGRGTADRQRGLFVTQGLDGVKLGRSHSRVGSKDQTDRQRDSKSERDGHRHDDGCHVAYGVGQVLNR